MSININLPLSLYIHIPWCIKKCPYCDFNSHKKDSSKNNYSETNKENINFIFHTFSGAPIVFPFNRITEGPHSDRRMRLKLFSFIVRCHVYLETHFENIIIAN